MGASRALAEDDEFKPLMTDFPALLPRVAPPRSLLLARVAELSPKPGLGFGFVSGAASRVEGASGVELPSALLLCPVTTGMEFTWPGEAGATVDFMSSTFVGLDLFIVVDPSTEAADDVIVDEDARTDFESPRPFDAFFCCIAPSAAAAADVPVGCEDGVRTDFESPRPFGAFFCCIAPSAAAAADVPVGCEDCVRTDFESPKPFDAFFCCIAPSAAAAADVPVGCEDRERTDFESLTARVRFCCIPASAAAADDVPHICADGARTDLASLTLRVDFRISGADMGLVAAAGAATRIESTALLRLGLGSGGPAVSNAIGSFTAESKGSSSMYGTNPTKSNAGSSSCGSAESTVHAAFAGFRIGDTNGAHGACLTAVETIDFEAIVVGGR